MRRQDPAARPTIEEVKRELQKRGNEFVSVQRLNSLKTKVIPETEIDDTVIRDPIRIVDVRYNYGSLEYKLSAVPPGNWITAFNRPDGGYSSYYGRGPQGFNFAGDTAMIQPSGGETPEQWTEYAKNYVQMANRQYERWVKLEHRRALEAQREALRKAVEREEENKAMQARIANIKL